LCAEGAVHHVRASGSNSQAMTRGAAALHSPPVAWYASGANWPPIRDTRKIDRNFCRPRAAGWRRVAMRLRAFRSHGSLKSNFCELFGIWLTRAGLAPSRTPSLTRRLRLFPARHEAAARKRIRHAVQDDLARPRPPRRGPQAENAPGGTPCRRGCRSTLVRIDVASKQLSEQVRCQGNLQGTRVLISCQFFDGMRVQRRGEIFTRATEHASQFDLAEHVPGVRSDVNLGSSDSLLFGA
jgi:hypothetical protein